jgi:hypothetical protein
MRHSCRAPIQTEIVATRGIKPLMPEELFDMSNRTVVKEERRGHRVSQNMRAHRFKNVRPSAIHCERVLDPIPLPESTRRIALGHKQRVIIIPSLGQVTLKP